MYFLLGPNQIVRNIACLAAAHTSNSLSNLEELKRGYIESLRAIQPRVPQDFNHHSTVVRDPLREARLREFFVINSKLNDRQQSSVFAANQINLPNDKRMARLEQNLGRFRRQYPSYFAIFDLTINQIIAPQSQRAGGGTTSAAIGVIWINERPGWSSWDLLELCVHELAHTTMFIDELCHGHYTDYDLVFAQANYARSALLGEMRPLDKALHSVVVATDLLLARREFGPSPEPLILHPPSQRLVANARQALCSIKDLMKREAILTNRGQELVMQCGRVIEDFDETSAT